LPQAILMNERRSKLRGRTLKGGKILFHQGRSAIDCAVRNFSNGGACIEVTSPLGIPGRFELQLDGEIVTRQCTQRWLAGNRIGVSFDAAGQPDDISDLIRRAQQATTDELTGLRNRIAAASPLRDGGRFAAE
jgi:hypothetical protein